jgi:iron complex outermembrane receptor protein
MLVDSDSTTVGGRISGELEASLGTWTVGLDYQRNERDATRFWDFSAATPTDVQSSMWPGVELEQAGVFAELEAPVGEQGRLTVGARFDRMDASLDRGVAATRPAGPPWQLSPDELYDLYYGLRGEEAEEEELGLFARHEHALADGCTLFASASSSVRQADATERYLAAHNMDPTLRWIGNPGLEPERHRQLELGLSREEEAWTCAGSLFYDRVDQLILRDRARGQPGILQSDGASVYRNVDASLWGGELEVVREWDEAWSSRVTLAYVRAENRDEQRPLAQIPPLEGDASLEWEGSGKQAGIVLRWAADQHHTDTDPATGSGLDARSTPGWAVLDLYASLDVGERSRLRVGVENLLDHTYAYHVNRANVDPFNPDPVQVNEPGLLFWISLTLSL